MPSFKVRITLPFADREFVVAPMNVEQLRSFVNSYAAVQDGIVSLLIFQNAAGQKIYLPGKLVLESYLTQELIGS